MGVVDGGVHSIELGSSMFRHESGERIIEQRGVGDIGTESSGSGAEVSIDVELMRTATHATLGRRAEVPG